MSFLFVSIYSQPKFCRRQFYRSFYRYVLCVLSQMLWKEYVSWTSTFVLFAFLQNTTFQGQHFKLSSWMLVYWTWRWSLDWKNHPIFVSGRILDWPYWRAFPCPKCGAFRVQVRLRTVKLSKRNPRSRSSQSKSPKCLWNVNATERLFACLCTCWVKEKLYCRHMQAVVCVCVCACI